MQHSNATQTSTATADGAASAATQTSTSIIIVVIVIASTIILSTSLYILIRFISRRFRTTRHGRNPNFTNTTILPFSNNNNNNTRIFNSLPLFTFGSLGAKISAGDCAVCLSKFEQDDQLRLLPLCCHAFHADCIDAWLISNQTCPLCRSTVHPSESDVLDKILPNNRSNSFRIEIGSVSRRRTDFSGEAPRSYAIGSFEYIVDEEYEVPIGDARTQTHSDKDSTVITVPVAPGDNLAAEVAGERGSWLRDYVDRIATVSSRSFRSSGRFFSGSSRRTNAVAGVDDLEANNNRFGEEISELFRWLSGV